MNAELGGVIQRHGRTNSMLTKMIVRPPRKTVSRKNLIGPFIFDIGVDYQRLIAVAGKKRRTGLRNDYVFLHSVAGIVIMANSLRSWSA